MGNPAIRSLLATVIGVIIGIVVIALVEGLGHLAFPPPPGLDPSDPDLVASLPPGALYAVLAAWFIGTLAGAATAIAIARRVVPGWSVGLVIAALGLWTTQMFPHPPWMVVAAMVLPLLAVLSAKRALAGRITA